MLVNVVALLKSSSECYYEMMCGSGFIDLVVCGVMMQMLINRKVVRRKHNFLGKVSAPSLHFSCPPVHVLLVPILNRPSLEFIRVKGKEM